MFDLPDDQEEAQIRSGVAADPDAHEFSDQELAELRPVGQPKAVVTKQPVSIRLSPEVLDYFKATGKGWQTRIDLVLRDYIEGQRS